MKKFLEQYQAGYTAHGLSLPVTFFADDETALSGALTEATRGAAVLG